MKKLKAISAVAFGVAVFGVHSLVYADSNSLSSEHFATPEPQPIMYVGNATSQQMFCGIFIHDMQIADNTQTQYGDGMFGANLTAFLQQGDNQLQLAVYPGGTGPEDTHRDDGLCELTVIATEKNGAQDEMTNLTVTVENQEATIKTSKIYDDSHQTPLTNVDGVKKGWVNRFYRNLYVKSIPTWAWTKATPFEETPENMQKLRQAYIDLMDMVLNKDIDGLEKAWSLSSREKSIAEGGLYTPEQIFEQIDIAEVFEWEHIESFRQDWDKYTLVSYAGGKLVRLEYKAYSPLAFSSDSENRSISYTPYFSLIDGKIVLTR